MGNSSCGYKSTLMNNFLNTRTNIMNLQFGTNKCEKMHIGKNHNQDICSRLSVDTWKKIVIEDDKKKKYLKYFSKNRPLGRFFLVVAKSVPELCVCLSPPHAIFFEASNWPSDHMIRSRPQIGYPPPQKKCLPSSEMCKLL